MKAYRILVLGVLIVSLLAPLPAAAALVGSPQQSGLVTVSALSGPDVTTTSTAWQDVPQMKGAFTLATESSVALTLCGEANTSGGRLGVRALLDGAPTSPSDVVFAAGPYLGSRCFTFVANTVPAGVHAARLQWLVDAGSTGYIGDRTLTIAFAAVAAQEMALLAVAAPSGAALASSTSWADVPGLQGTLVTAAESDLTINCGGEAYTDSGRLFLRALVDGQVAEPSDAVLVTGSFTGVRGFAFISHGLPPGNHDVRLQWRSDSAGAGHLGDRTLTAVASTVSTGALLAGRLNVAAPSGPWETTTSSGWVDVPGLSGELKLPAAGDIAVRVGAEILAAPADKSVWLRVLLDGVPANPSDVLWAVGDWTGSYGFEFVLHGSSRGSHQLQVQWSVSSGGTAYVGDRTVSAISFARQQPLLIAAIESDRPDGYPMGGLWADSVVDTSGGGRSFQPYVRERIWGAFPSVADYFLENSGGRYFLVEGGLLGPYKKYLDEKTYRETVPDPFTKMQLEALGYADQEFDFSLYDRDGDGFIRNNELQSLVVLYQDTTDGFVRPLPNLVTNDGVTLDLSWIPHAYLKDFQEPGQTGLLLHELAHVLINAGDMYENGTTLPDTGGWDPTAPGPYSLMDRESSHPHLDPWHKLDCGRWFEAVWVTHDGYYDVPAVETASVIYLLRDLGSHFEELFLVENRRQIGYEQALPDQGIAIWHIDQSRDDYRSVVEIEPACGPTDPLRWHEYLYDGAGSLWGRDFWNNSTPLNSRWHDGSPSGVGVWAIGETADSVSVYLDVPGPGLLVDVKPDVAWQSPSGPANFQVRLVNTGQSADTFNLYASAAAGGRSWPQNPVTLAPYEEAIVALSVEPAWGSQAQVSFTVTGQSASDAAIMTNHIATVRQGVFISLPLVLGK